MAGYFTNRNFVKIFMLARCFISWVYQIYHVPEDVSKVSFHFVQMSVQGSHDNNNYNDALGRKNCMTNKKLF